MTTDTLSLGQQLKQQREALNYSIEDVAKKTHLKKSHIETLEADIFILAGVPPAFMRGYVRNYVRFLRLPEELINSVDYGEDSVSKPIKRTKSTAINNHKAQMRWIKNLTWIVLLGAVCMTLVWWWQEHQKDQAVRAELINTAQTAPQEPQPAPVAEPTVAPTESSVTQTPVAQDTTAQVTENPVETAATPTGVENTPNTTEPEKVTVEPTPDTTTVTPAAASEPVATTEPQQPVNVLQQLAPEQAPQQTVEPQTPAVQEELRIEVTGAESWIAVYDGKNKRLAEKLYNSGEVLSFNDNEQYRLVVGAPANVTIYYKGQLVPLKVDGRVARFKLPLAN